MRYPHYVPAPEEAEFLKNYDIHKYPCPSVACDTALFAKEEDGTLSLLLIKRGGHPYKGMYALPGGFAQPGESLEETAARELLEETGVRTKGHLVAICSAPGRDPRGWIISPVYAAVCDRPQVKAGEDAAEADWWKVGSLEKTPGDPEEYTLTLTRNWETLTLKANRYQDGTWMAKNLPGGLAADHDSSVIQSLLFVRNHLL